jgi:hypothetical protein
MTAFLRKLWPLRRTAPLTGSKSFFGPQSLEVPVPNPAASATSIDASPAPAVSVSSTPCWQTASYSPERHARQLLSWLREQGWDREVLYPDMLRLYHAMCEELNWATRPWAPVAREFTRITTRRKVYRWCRAANGTMHRLRVYPIMRSDPGADSEQVTPQVGDLSLRAASRTESAPTTEQAHAAKRIAA